FVTLSGDKSMRLTTITALAAVGLAAFSGDALAQRDFVFAANGGPYEAGFRKDAIPRFEKENNVRVIYQPGVSLQTLAKLQAQRNNPQIDVSLVDDGPAWQACQLGLTEKLDLARLPNHTQMYEAAYEKDNCGIGMAVNAAVLYYNK